MRSLYTAKATRSVLPVPFQKKELDDELLRQGVDLTRFLKPDFEVPLLPQQLIANVPKGAVVKGMFFENLARGARRFKVACEGRYTAFRDYSMTSYMELVIAYARARYPHAALREAVRRIGWEAYPALMESIAGKVLFAVAGRDLRAALTVVPRAYEHSINPGRVAVRISTEHQVLLEFRSVWNFADCYQVGCMEGGCRAYNRTHFVTTDVISECDVDMLIRW